MKPTQAVQEKQIEGREFLAVQKKAELLQAIMAEEFQIGGGNWWGSSRTRFEGGTTPSSSSGLISMGSSFGWPAEIVDLNYKAISSSNFTNSVSASVSSSPMPFQDTRKLAQDPNSQMMGLGLSSHAMDWNQNNPR